MNLLKIINWRDIIYILTMQITLKFGFINIFNFENPLTNSLFFVLITALIFILLSGFIINNYFYSQKSKLKFSLLIYATLLLILGIGLGIYVSYKIQRENYSLIFVVFAIIIFASSLNLKNRSFFRSLAISLLFSFSVMVIWWFSEPTQLKANEWELFLKLEVIVVLIAILVFLGNLSRSIFIDIANYHQDKKNDIETLVTVFSKEKSKMIIFTISILTNIATLITFVFYVENYIAFILLTIISIPTSAFLYLELQKNKKPEEYFKIVKILDMILFLGFITIPIVATLLKNALE